MGVRKTYRWDKRRKRRRSGSSDLLIFQMIALMLVFAIWLIFWRLPSLMALTSQHCIEAVAAFGQTESMPPVFEYNARICLALIGFIAATSIAHWHALKTNLWQLAFQLVLVISAFILYSLNHALTIENNSPPDGFVQVQRTIESVLDDGTIVTTSYNRQLPELAAGATLQQVKDGRIWIEAFDTNCVWLEQKVIAAPASYRKRFDDYANATLEERKTITKHNTGKYIKWRKHTLWDEILMQRDFYAWDFTWAELLQSRQYYRMMTPEEVERFKTRQSCLETALANAEQHVDCDYHLTYPLKE